MKKQKKKINWIGVVVGTVFLGFGEFLFSEFSNNENLPAWMLFIILGIMFLYFSLAGDTTSSVLRNKIFGFSNKEPCSKLSGYRIAIAS